MSQVPSGASLPPIAVQSIDVGAKLGQIANKLVSVQPMTVPSGGIFYMDYRYGGSPAESIDTSRNPKKRRKKKAG